MLPEAFVEVAIALNESAFDAFMFATWPILAPPTSQMHPISISHPTLPVPHILFPEALISTTISILHGALSVTFIVRHVTGICTFWKIFNSLLDFFPDVEESLLLLSIWCRGSTFFVLLAVQETTFVDNSILCHFSVSFWFSREIHLTFVFCLSEVKFS